MSPAAFVNGSLGADHLAERPCRARESGPHDGARLLLCHQPGGRGFPSTSCVLYLGKLRDLCRMQAGLWRSLPVGGLPA